MRIRSSLLLLVSLALALASCADSSSTLTDGEGSAGDNANDSVAQDSAPVIVETTTTAPWEETLKEYPLLTLLDEDERDGSVGSSSFVMVDENNVPVFSGSADFPQFIVTIDAWYGAVNYVEHTMSTSNVELVDGTPRNTECGNNLAHLQKTGLNEYVRTFDQLPALRGTILSWDSPACEEDRPVDLDKLFEGSKMQIDVDETGFELWSPENDLSAPIRFRKLVPTNQAPPDTTTSIAPETTDVSQTTTTGVEGND